MAVLEIDDLQAKVAEDSGEQILQDVSNGNNALRDEQGAGILKITHYQRILDYVEPDWDKMLDKTLKGPIARILEALDISWEEVKSGQEQTGLGSFT